jgi:hypothetical protein
MVCTVLGGFFAADVLWRAQVHDVIDPVGLLLAGLLLGVTLASVLVQAKRGY